MASEGSHVLQNTIQSIFQHHQQTLLAPQQAKLKAKGIKKGELELALTVLLVDLASADQDFAAEEYHIIQNGLMRLFGTGKHEVTQLVHQAKAALANLRGISKFGETLNKHLDHDQKKAVMEVIEEVILADGKQDGFEVYLRHKIAGLLGLDMKQLNGPTE